MAKCRFTVHLLPRQPCRRNARSLVERGESLSDIVDAETRSRMMAGIRSGNTRPELRLRRELHALGFRFRLHAAKLPGKPDLVFAKHRAVIFVHGCFWHRHKGCRITSTPATNAEFWSRKFARNVERDGQNLKALAESGWRAAVIWECELRRKEISGMTERIAIWLNSSDSTLELPPPSPRLGASG